MHTLVLKVTLATTLAFFGFGAVAAQATEVNHFVKGTKSYQKTTPSDDEGSQTPDSVSSEKAENPQDISPAAGAEEDNTKPSAKDMLQESMKLPRK